MRAAPWMRELQALSPLAILLTRFRGAWLVLEQIALLSDPPPELPEPPAPRPHVSTAALRTAGATSARSLRGNSSLAVERTSGVF